MTDLEEYVTEAILEMSERMSNFTEKGSGWTFAASVSLNISGSTAPPYVGGSYIKTPTFLELKKALANVRNTDNHCFLYSYLAGMYPLAANCTRASIYEKMVSGKLTNHLVDGKKIPIVLPTDYHSPMPVSRVLYYSDIVYRLSFMSLPFT